MFQPSVELRPADYRALARFRYHLRRFLHFSEQAARAAGVEPHQHQLLLALKGLAPDGAATVGDLAEWLQIRHHSAVELVDRAAALDLVARRPDPDDRRRVRVALTARGEALLRDLSVQHRAELQVAAPTLLESLSALLEPAATVAPAHA